MKKFLTKIANFILKYRIWGIILFLGLAGASGYMMTKVSINYDLSKYLGDTTETSLALSIIQDEFGENGNLQVMVDGISKDEAEDLKDDLKEVNYVITVSFDADDTNYYKDSTALYVVLIDGNDYSSNAASVTKDVTSLVNDKYQTVYYGGSTIEKQRLMESITSQMPLIMIIAISLVCVILLISSKSWIEPLILLVCSAVAIIINLGTNLMFGEISYITNSVCAILQLALSMDYSIVLINAFRKNKEKGLNAYDAMVKSLVQVSNPISASGLTTMFGLFALIFMSFRIGFDIGIVLMKGILLSLICALTLLPSVVLLLDKPIEKTKKKTLKLKGNWIVSFTKKANKFVVPVTLILIIAGGCINFSLGTYTYNDSSMADKQIQETFGNSNSICLVYKKSDNQNEIEQAFIDDISSYKTESGDTVLKDYTAISNTIEEEYDAQKASENLDITVDQANLLLGLYKINKNKNSVKLDANTFLYEADYLIKNDEDAKEIVDADTINTISLLVAIDNLGDTDLTYQEFYDALNSEPLGQLESSITLSELQQVYGTYYFDEVKDEKIVFSTMLSFIVSSLNEEPFNSLISTDEKTQLTYLNTSLASFETKLTKQEFQYYVYSTYGISLTEMQVAYIYSGYFASIGQVEEDSAPIIPVLNFMVDQHMITDTTATQTIKGYYQLLVTSKTEVTYQEFIPLLSQIAAASGSTSSIEISDEQMEQVYIIYYNSSLYFSIKVLNGVQLSSFLLDEIEKESYLASMMSNKDKENIEDLDLVLSFLNSSTTYNYEGMYEEINDLKETMHNKSISASIDADKVSGVYLKYILANDENYVEPVTATLLVNYVDTNKESNSLLKAKLTIDQLKQIEEAKADLVTAKDLLIGDNYNRLLLSIDLSNESSETTKYVEYLEGKVKEYFGEDAHIAGEMVSTDDLRLSFNTDQMLISVISIISILLIILLIFRSLSLPVILVIIIQGAIWIAFATNPLTGNVFFMSYIIASSILMGSTIDYGILMGSTYVAKRNKMDKESALLEATNVALPTVLTSGSILIIVGFVICFVATQSSISTVGLLIGKGAIISVLLVLLALPSFLYLLDKPIMKTTWHRKEKGEPKQIIDETK